MTLERHYVTDVLDPAQRAANKHAAQVAKTREAIEAHLVQQRAIRAEREAEREATLQRLRNRCGLDPQPPKDWTWLDRMRGRKRPLTLRDRLMAETEADRGC